MSSPLGATGLGLAGRGDPTGPTGPAEGVDLRPVGLGAAAWLGSWLATAGEPRWWLAGAAIVAVGVVASALSRSRWWWAATLVLAVALGCGVLRVQQLSSGPVAELADARAVVQVDAVLRGTPRTFAAGPTRPQSWVSAATVTAVAGRGDAWATGVSVELWASGEEVSRWQRLAPGTLVRVTARLGQADPDSPAAAEARARGGPQVIAPPGPVDAAVERVRAGLRAACAGLSPDARALVPALVVGDTAALDPETTATFKTTGLTHLTAVSGANLVLLLAFVRMVLVAVGVRGRAVSLALAVTVFGFVALCLGEPSVVRAAAMGLVALAALGRGGTGRQGLRYLAVAAWALVLWDPWISRSFGFALSVTASAGLLWWAGRWADALSRWAPRWVAEAVSVPLAAQLATQPIVTAISGQVSLVGLLANALAAPLVGPATVCGFLAAGLSVVWPPGAAALAWLAGWCAQGLCWIARLCAALPGAATTWPTTWAAIVLVAVVCWLIGLAMPTLLGSRALAVAAAVALVVALLRTPTPPGWPPAEWSVLSCDVGQGDATLIRAGPAEAVLVDAGPDPVALERCLGQAGVTTVPLVVLTHLHADHVSGLPALRRFGVRQVVTSAIRTPAGGEAIVAGLVAAGPVRVTASTGMAWAVGAARVEVLSAASALTVAGEAEGESSAENDASLVLRASVEGLSVLLAGDLEDAGQAGRIGLGGAVDVDVLLVPHHGSSRQDPAFLELTTPQLALISVGAGNDYGHPTQKTLALVGGLTGTVLRTDQHGSIAVARSPDGLRVTTQR